MSQDHNEHGDDLLRSILCAHEDASILARHFVGERALWAAVVQRALQDARGVRLGSDAESSNNHLQRAARKWFRKRERSYVGGWGWIIDEIDIPRWLARRLEREAVAEGPIFAGRKLFRSVYSSD